MSRTKLAKITGNDLDFDPTAAAAAAGEYAEVIGRANCALGDEEPVLTEAVRALLIMSGCTARFCGNYWKVERRNPEQPRDVHLRPGQKWRTQTGVPAVAAYEDWRRELNAFVGGLGS